MSRKIEAAGNILTEILNYMLVFSVEILLFKDILRQWPGDWKTVCLVLVPVFYYLLREFCGNIPWFFILHFLPIAGVCIWYGSRMEEKVIFGFITILSALLSIRRKLAGRESGAAAIPIPAAAGFIFAIYLADSLQGKGACGNELMRLMTGYMALYFLQFYLMQFARYVDINNRTTEHIPMNRAFLSSAGLVTGFVGISTALVALLADRQLADSISEKISSIFRAILIFLFSLFPSGRADSEDIITETMDAAGGYTWPMEETEPSLLARIMDIVAVIFAIAVVIALLLAAIAGFVRLVKKAFLKKQQKREEGTEESDKIEFLTKSEKKAKEEEKVSFRLWARTPEQAVRRQYFKTIYRKWRILKEEKTGKLILAGTARECCMLLFPNHRQEAFDFAVLYEKARYGSKACNREDVRKMKHLAAALLK